MTARRLTVADILALGLAALPADKKGMSRLIDREGWRTSPLAREGERGWEYQVGLLPAEAQAEFLARELRGSQPQTLAEQMDAADRAAFEALPVSARVKSAERHDIVSQVVGLRGSGMQTGEAVARVARNAGISSSTLWGWMRLIDGVAHPRWLLALAPQHKGRTATAECDPRAWDFLVADYMRPERPSFVACHRRMIEAAAAHGWGPIPASKTLQRRLEAQIPAASRMLARQGRDALARIFPHQSRDRSGFAAMEAVNADGHQFDVFCRFEDGSIGRPVMVGVQDLASGMVLGWRVAETENWTAVRLAFADTIVRFGVPQHAWLDNGRAFASKWLSGGAKTRYRFKIKDDDPRGILPLLGIQLHWTTPYHGQAKPIERAWRDLCEEISRHPECAGAYTGNNVNAKPDNYGSRAIPIEQFRELVHREIVRHNGRAGRKGGICNGRSFAQTFADSIESGNNGAMQADPWHRRLLLLAAEGVTSRKPTGEVHFGGNRYWDEALIKHMGRKLIVRFDPEDLHAPLAVYSKDDRLICEAPCIEASGFSDSAAAQDHGRRKRAWMKAQTEILALERRLGIAEVAQLLRPANATPRVVSLFGATTPSSGAPKSETITDKHAADQALSRAIRALADGEEANILPFHRREAD